MLRNEKYILVDNEDSLVKLLADLDQYDVAAVDTERNSRHHYPVRLCLLQIAVGKHYYIVDSLCGLNFDALFKTRAMQTLILHAAENDLNFLWKTYGYLPKRIFDTMLAAKYIGEEKYGLAYLVEKYFGDKLKKENQKADWTIRPLSFEMCEYAIHDTLYLNELSAILTDKLNKLNRMSWFTEHCNILIEHAKIPPGDQWRIEGTYKYQPRELNIFKHIWNWREKQAEELNRPTFKVMSQQLMIAIVDALSPHFPNINASYLPKLPINFKGKRLQSFLNMLRRAVSVPECDWPRRLPKASMPPKLPSDESIDKFKRWRNEKAEELQINEKALIASNLQLNWLAAQGTIPMQTRYKEAHLMLWQQNMWNEILQDKCNYNNMME